jgi:hypothetical protein
MVRCVLTDLATQTDLKILEHRLTRIADIERATMAYPPKNGRPVELPVLRLEVEDANGVKVFDTNGIVLSIQAYEVMRALGP